MRLPVLANLALAVLAAFAALILFLLTMAAALMGGLAIAATPASRLLRPRPMRGETQEIQAS